MKNVIFKSLFIITLIIILLPNISFGADTGRQNLDWAQGAESFLSKGNADDTGVNKDKLRTASSNIYNMLTSIGMIIVVVVGIILGIIFMASSADDKAKVKESLMPYLIGCFVVFGAFGIWKIMVNTFQGI